jgi:hypothetical protein
MSRANNFHGKPGPGRPKGARNKATQEARALAGKYLTAEGYDESLVDRLKAGKAPHMEVLLWHYWKGKPKEAVEVEGSESLAAGRSSRRHVAGARTSKQAPAST